MMELEGRQGLHEYPSAFSILSWLTIEVTDAEETEIA